MWRRKKRMPYSPAVGKYRTIIMWLETDDQGNFVLVDASFETEEERSAFILERSTRVGFYDVVGIIESFWTEGGEGLPQVEETTTNGFLPIAKKPRF